MPWVWGSEEPRMALCSSCSMKFLRPLWQACKWKNFVLASPSSSKVAHDRWREMVRDRDAKPRHLNFSLVRRSCYSWESRQRSWAWSSLNTTSEATANWIRMLPTCFWLHRWRAWAVLRNFWSSTRQAPAFCTGQFQPSTIALRKPGTWARSLRTW
jgi:hypothetical protein